MTVPTGTILKVVATILWEDGNIMQNVFNAVVSGGGGPWDNVDIVDDAIDWVETMYNTLTARISGASDGSQVQVYRWDAIEEDWDEVGAWPWVWTPSNATDQLPRGVAGLLNAKTSDSDSSGKKYIGGLCEDHCALGLWTPTTIGALVDFGAEWVVPFVGLVSGASWVSGVWSVKDLVLNPFTLAVIIPTVPAYQRRRKRGVGV